MKFLNDFPEIRPFKLDTSIDDNLKTEFTEYSNNVDYKNLISYPDDDIRDENLYVDKKTYRLKDNIEQFDNYKANHLSLETKLALTITAIIIIFIVLIKLK